MLLAIRSLSGAVIGCENWFVVVSLVCLFAKHFCLSLIYTSHNALKALLENKLITSSFNDILKKAINPKNIGVAKMNIINTVSCQGTFIIPR